MAQDWKAVPRKRILEEIEHNAKVLGYNVLTRRYGDGITRYKVVPDYIQDYDGSYGIYFSTEYREVHAFLLGCMQMVRNMLRTVESAERDFIARHSFAKHKAKGDWIVYRYADTREAKHTEWIHEQGYDGDLQGIMKYLRQYGKILEAVYDSGLTDWDIHSRS